MEDDDCKSLFKPIHTHLHHTIVSSETREKGSIKKYWREGKKWHVVYDNVILDDRRGVNHDDHVENMQNPLFNCVWSVNIEKVMTE